jgi:hypothetical protein
MSKVNIVNTTRGSVFVEVREIPFRHDWTVQGAKFAVEHDVLEQLMYDKGFKYMIDTGMLYIEDMEEKKALGIEPEEAEEPVNVIVLTDKERRRYMVNLSLEEFKEKVRKLSYEQVTQLADYAVANRLADFDKAEFLKELCGRDILQAIRLSAQNKEA